MEIKDYLKMAVEKNASDVFIGARRHISLKIDGVISPATEETPDADKVGNMITSLYEMANRPMKKYNETGDDDFPVSVPGVARFRVSAYRQRGTMAAIIRVVQFGIPNHKELRIPGEVMEISSEKNGIILVTGPAGSGKTTTLACIIDIINQSRNCHIVTLEDPIEYLHKDKKSLVSQREISTDTNTYISALRACLRQAPDIILLGEMRDLETIATAMTAAETGHLVLSTLHTLGAVNTIDRIVDVFPPAQQQQIRVQLSMVLKTVVSQQLLPDKSGGLIPAFEIAHINKAIRNLIREFKTYQINTVIQTSGNEGMISMDGYILRLYTTGAITAETAIGQASNTEQMMRYIETTPPAISHL
ncbi:MAG: PilT/PilU family type 4a pilus ATPase [Oscillospiraceae bacterium]|nr:PilT/PilU family type 4a pilus ATPase [Oscillospiraceae bacterium]